MKNTRILTLIFVLAFLTLLVGCFPPITENQAPIITSNPITTATVGETYTYDVEATDPDGDTLTYSLATPAGMTINSATGVISWLPSSAQVGDNAVKVVVSDGDLSVVQSFTITVSKPTPTPIPTKYYTITATVGANGSIDPSGAVKVKKGKDKTFTITPDSVFYGIDLVLVDGQHLVQVPYTFTNVTDDHTIHATFELLGPVYNETQDTHYNTIQEAIDDAGNPSNTILVMAGTYVGNLEIDVESLTLKSTVKHGAVIQTEAGFNAGSGYGGITVLADGVTLDGFRIEQGVVQAIIHTHDSQGTIIKNNSIIGVNNARPRGIDIGYALAKSDGVLVEGNEFVHLYCGVYINQGEALIVEENIFEDMIDGALVFDGTWSNIDNIEVNDNVATDANYLLYFWNVVGSVTAEGNTLVNTELSNYGVYNTDQNIYFPTIQGAINVASDFETIEVAAGIYNENVDVNKSLTLQGEDRETTQIIFGWGYYPSEPPLTISADGVTVSGFTIRSGPYIENPGAWTIAIGEDNALLTDLNVIKEPCLHQLNGNPTNKGAAIGYIVPNIVGFTFTDSTVKSAWNGLYTREGSSNIIVRNIDFACPGENVIFIKSITSATIEGNEITFTEHITGENRGQYGVTVTRDSDNIDIIDNQFVGSDPLVANHIGILLQAYPLVGTMGDIDILNNGISSFNTGILVEDVDTSGIFIHYNNIFSNVTGVNNIATAGLDATDNWWGDASGPYHPITNPLGAGDTVSDNVGYIPWSTNQY